MGNEQRVLIGFDGFIDTLLHCVAQRTGPHAFKRLSTIPLFSKKVQQAAHQSANIEVVTVEQTLGGNAPLLARALLTMGIPSTLIGTCGYPDLHPLFRPLQEKGIALHSFAPPGLTDALEFTDGKLLLGDMGEINTITVEEAFRRLPAQLIPTLLSTVEMLVTVNWTMMPLVEQFWNYLLENKNLLHKNRPGLFVDLADPAKRRVTALKRGLHRLHQLRILCNVTLGLNRSESHQVCTALGLSPAPSLRENAEQILTTLKISSIVVHAHCEAAVAYTSGKSIKSASLKVPLIKHPVRSTGAGDTFNAGYIAGMLHHMEPERCLKAAVAASREFVRTGHPPTEKTICP